MLGAGGPPPWSPLDRAGHHRFVTSVRAALLDRGVKLDRAGLIAGELPLPDDALRPTWDLRALVARCAHAGDPERWEHLVAEDLARHLRPPAPRPPRAARVPEPPRVAPAPPRVSEPPRAGTERPSSRIIPPERTRRQTTELDTTHLRTQVWSRDNPVVAAFALDAMIHREVGGGLVEVAVWDLDGAAEHTVARDDRGLGGLEPDEVLTRGRVQAVAADVDGVVFQPVELAGAPAEVAVSNGYYLGPCMLQLLERVVPPAVTIVCPVSTHHWILLPASPTTTPVVLAAVRQLAATILAQRALGATERLGDALLWWPGGGAPEEIVVDGDGAVRLSPDQKAALKRL